MPTWGVWELWVGGHVDWHSKAKELLRMKTVCWRGRHESMDAVPRNSVAIPSKPALFRAVEKVSFQILNLRLCRALLLQYSGHRCFLTDKSLSKFKTHNLRNSKQYRYHFHALPCLRCPTGAHANKNMFPKFNPRPKSCKNASKFVQKAARLKCPRRQGFTNRINTLFLWENMFLGSSHTDKKKNEILWRLLTMSNERTQEGTVFAGVFAQECVCVWRHTHTHTQTERER